MPNRSAGNHDADMIRLIELNETAPQRETSEASNIVEMSWDPITRIVGSLGIFTKIDFATEKWSSAIALPRSSAATASS